MPRKKHRFAVVTLWVGLGFRWRLSSSWLWGWVDFFAMLVPPWDHFSRLVRSSPANVLAFADKEAHTFCFNAAVEERGRATKAFFSFKLLPCTT